MICWPRPSSPWGQLHVLVADMERRASADLRTLPFDAPIENLSLQDLDPIRSADDDGIVTSRRVPKRMGRPAHSRVVAFLLAPRRPGAGGSKFRAA